MIIVLEFRCVLYVIIALNDLAKAITELAFPIWLS